jgi:hypothetical protein
MKKADNFDAKKWLTENKVTTQSRLNEAIGIGPMGATSQKRFTAASGEEGSSSPDEFSLSVVTNPLTGRKTNFNYKLKNVEFEKKKIQELFGNLFKSSPKIKFTFERTGDAKEKKATMEIKLKDDKFVLANSTTTEDITGSIPDEGEAKKFIDYLLNKSQWGDDLKQTFENIEQALTPASLK